MALLIWFSVLLVSVGASGSPKDPMRKVKVISSIEVITGPLEAGPIKFETHSSILGFRGLFRVPGMDKPVPLLVDTSAEFSLLGGSSKWSRKETTDLFGEGSFGFGAGESVAKANRFVSVALPALHVYGKLFLGELEARLLDVSGVFSVGPESPVGRKIFAVYPKTSNRMTFTDDFADLETRCGDSELVELVADVSDGYFVVPRGGAISLAGKEGQKAQFVFASGKEGVDVPRRLYRDLVRALASTLPGLRSPLDPTLDFMTVDPSVCEDPAQFSAPRIAVTFASFTLSLALRDYTVQLGSECLIAVRVARDESRLSIGPAFLKKAVTVFDAPNGKIRMCRAAKLKFQKHNPPVVVLPRTERGWALENRDASIASSIDTVGGPSTKRVSQISWEMDSSLFGFGALFRVSGNDPMRMSVDTSATMSVLDAHMERFWPEPVTKLANPYQVGFGGGVKRMKSAGLVNGVFSAWDVQETFSIGDLVSSVIVQTLGIISLNARSPLGQKPFLLMPLSQNTMMYTSDVADAADHCLDRRMTVIPLDAGALANEHSFVAPRGSIRIGLKRHEAAWLMASGKEGIEVPADLYAEFVANSGALEMQVPEDPYAEFIRVHESACRGTARFNDRMPEIRVTLGDEKFSVRLVFSDYVTMLGEMCLIPIRIAAREDRLAFGPAFLRKAVTLFDRRHKRLQMCLSM